MRAPARDRGGADQDVGESGRGAATLSGNPQPPQVELALRAYQIKAVNDLREALRRHRRVCFQLPTGGGKTIIFGFIASGVVTRGRCALILVHRRELIRQTLDKLRFFGIEAGVIAAGWPAHPERPIQVASIQTLARRLDQAPEADLVIVDEAHHVVAGTWRAVLALYPETRTLGVTATPERLDGKGLADQFDELVCGPSVADLIAGGFLADARVLSAPREVDLSGVKKLAGDFAVGALAEVMSDSKVVGDAVEHYAEHAAGRRAIAFCVTVNHAELVAERFRAAGYRAASVDGSMRKEDRDLIIGGLATGALDVVTSCELVSEGLDIPDVGAAILLRPTQSLTLFLQQVGRALRPKADGAPAIIRDHAGNARRHGHPADPRVWSLEGRKRRLQLTRDAIAEFSDDAGGVKQPPAEIDGHLVELSAGALTVGDLKSMPLRQALALCETEAEVRTLGRIRGYKPGWAYHVMQRRREQERILPIRGRATWDATR
jgi:DNA repair protein RadD